MPLNDLAQSVLYGVINNTLLRAEYTLLSMENHAVYQAVFSISLHLNVV
jgi:hypothetical protein